MPFINSKVTVKLSEKEKNLLKAKMGEIIKELPGKTEEWLMVSFDDDKTIYFKGKKMEHAAFIEVKIFGTAEREHKNKAAHLLSSLFEEKLNIPKDSIYITFNEIKDWAWNGELF